MSSTGPVAEHGAGTCQPGGHGPIPISAPGPVGLDPQEGVCRRQPAWFSLLIDVYHSVPLPSSL